MFVIEFHFPRSKFKFTFLY